MVVSKCFASRPFLKSSTGNDGVSGLRVKVPQETKHIFLSIYFQIYIPKQRSIYILPMIMIMIMECKCLRCGYGWEARINNPKECPRCKSRDWEQPKKEET